MQQQQPMMQQQMMNSPQQNQMQPNHGMQIMKGMNLNKTAVSQKPDHALDGIQGMDLGNSNGSNALANLNQGNMMKESGIEPMFGNSNNGMKQGTNTDLNTVLQQVDENTMIPLIPEMQHFTDSFMNGQGIPQMSSGAAEFGGKPEIMDKGLLGNSPMGMSGLGGMGPMGGMGPSPGGLPMYDSSISSMAASQGYNMSGGGLLNMTGGNMFNENFAEEINNVITKELNSKLEQVGTSNNEDSSSKKKKKFFLTKRMTTPNLI